MLYNGLYVLWLLNGCSAIAIANDGDFGWFLTAAHCCTGETGTIQTPGGPIGVRWKHIDTANDWAIGKTFGNVTPPANGRLGTPKPGPATIIGYPAGRPTVRHGTLTTINMDIDGGPKRLIEIQPPLVPGTSGGAVVQDGELVGIATHSTPIGGACTIPKDLYTDANRTNPLTDATTITQRDAVIAALIAWLTTWWHNRQNRKPTTTTAAT